MKRGAYDQLATDVAILFKELNEKGHTVVFQWIPSHCGIAGNELADAEAQKAHHNGTLLSIPITRQDANAILYGARKQAAALYSSDPQNRHERLHKLDPERKFWVSHAPRLRRSQETLLHRLRLGVALTRKYLHTIGLEDSPDCLLCGCPESIEHLLSVCPKYSSERKNLETALLRLDTRPLSEQKILGTWADNRKQSLAVKALLTFLGDSSLDSRL